MAKTAFYAAAFYVPVTAIMTGCALKAKSTGSRDFEQKVLLALEDDLSLQQVVQRFGQPQTKKTDPNGQVTWTYGHTTPQGKTKTASFVFEGHELVSVELHGF